MRNCNTVRDLIKQPTWLNYYKKTIFYISVHWHTSCFSCISARCVAAQFILIRTGSFAGIFVKRYILIYSMVLVLVSVGFTVVSNHLHFHDVCDSKNLQTVCHYLKNPVVTKSPHIIITLAVPALLQIIYCIILFKLTTFHSPDPLTFKNQRLIALSSFPHRAPPGR